MALSKARISGRWESLSREVLAGSPRLRLAGLRLRRGDQAGDPRVPHLPARPDHTSAGGFAVVRESSGPGAAPGGGRRPGRRERSLLHASGARRRERGLRQRARCAGSGARARRRRARPSLRPRPSRTADPGAPALAPGQAARPARGPMDPRRDHRRRRVREQRAPRHPGRQPARPRALLRAVRRSGSAGQFRPVRLPRSASRGVLRRLGPRCQRIRRHPALRRGPRPLQPRPLRPRRASSPHRARHSVPAGPHTTSASTTPASSTSTIPSSASST